MKPWRIGTEDYGDREILPRDVISRKLSVPNAERIFFVRHALRAGFTIEEIFGLTKIDRWFLTQIKQIVDFEGELAEKKTKSQNMKTYFFQNKLTLLALFFVINTNAQDVGVPVDHHLTQLKNNVEVFSNPNRNESVIVFPQFAFRQNGTNTAIFTYIHGDKAKIVIKLQINPEDLIENIATGLRMYSLTTKDYGDLFSRMDRGKILTATIKHLLVTDSSGGDYKFDKLELNKPTGNEYDLAITVPLKAKEEIINEIQSGERKFDVEYTVPGKYEASRSAVRLSSELIRATDAFREIVGGAGQNNFIPQFVDRNVKTKLLQNLKDNFRIFWDIENPADIQILSARLDQYLDSIFQSQSLKLDDNGWDKLKAMSFDGRDIQGAELKHVVQKIHDDLKNHGESSIDTSASAVIKGVPVGAKFDGKWLNDHQEAHDRQLELEGSSYLPVGLKVYAVQNADLNKTGNFDQEISRSARNDIPNSIELHSSVTVSNIDRLSSAEAQLSQLNLVGSVIAFAGPTNAIPNGWRLCDGSPLPEEGKFHDLFIVIGQTYGTGVDEAGRKIFHLPDYRGMFLRGVNLDRNGAFADPDIKLRTNSTAIGNQVGSVQLDEFKHHDHPLNMRLNLSGAGTTGGRDAQHLEKYGIDAGHPEYLVNENGGTETRPKNIYVHYIIKY